MNNETAMLIAISEYLEETGLLSEVELDLFRKNWMNGEETAA